MSSSATAAAFTVSTATYVPSTGAMESGGDLSSTSGEVLSVPGTSDYFHLSTLSGTAVLNGDATSCSTSGGWSASATYPSATDMPSELCVIMFDVGGAHGFNPKTNNDNTLSGPGAVDPIGNSAYCWSRPLLTPTLSSSASPQAGTVGTEHSFSDTLTVGGADGAAQSGTATFRLYASGTSGCGALQATGTSTVSSGTATFTVGWTPTSSGTYYWQATYTGDSLYSAGTEDAGCDDSAESVVVSPPASPTLSSSASPRTGTVGTEHSFSDTLTVTGVHGPAQSGGASFTLYSAGSSGCGTSQATATASVSSGTATVSVPWTATAAGTYYWRVSFTGDSVYSAGTEDAGCDVSAESVVVSFPPTPTLSSSASPRTGTVGTTHSFSDTLTVGGADGAAQSGSVTFRLYAAGSSGCGALQGTATASVSSGTATGSVQWTPTAAGTYYWQASYTGNSVYTAGTEDAGCNVSAESVVVSLPPTPTLSSSASPRTGTVGTTHSFSDTLTVGGADGAAQSGSVTFRLYAAGSSGCGALQATGTSTVSSGTATVSVQWTPTEAGTYYWQDSYTGNSVYTAGTEDTGCSVGAESVVVSPPAPVTPTLSSVAGPAAGMVGTPSSIGDTLTVIGRGSAPTGTVTFSLYTAGCTQRVLGPSPAIDLRGAASTASASYTVTWTPPAAGTYYWQATYDSTDSLYNGATDDPGCSAGSESVVIVPAPTPVPTTPTTPNFAVSKSDLPGNGTAVPAGATIPYAVTVRNVGTGTGSVQVSDRIPANLALSTTPSCAPASPPDSCTVSVAAGTITIYATLASGHAATVTFDALVGRADRASVFNSAVVVLGACSTCLATIVNPVIALSATEQSLPPEGSTVAQSSTVTFQVVLSDSGTGRATGITVTETAPPGTTYVPGSASCGTAKGCSASGSTSTVTWSNVVVPAEGTVTLTFSVTVNAGDADGEQIAGLAAFTNRGSPGCSTATCNTNTVVVVVGIPPALHLSRTMVSPGEGTVATGVGCPAGSLVHLSIRGTPVGMTYADSRGTFSTPISPPDQLPGQQTVVATCGGLQMATLLSIVDTARASSPEGSAGVFGVFLLLGGLLVKGQYPAGAAKRRRKKLAKGTGTTAGGAGK